MNNEFRQNFCTENALIHLNNAGVAPMTKAATTAIHECACIMTEMGSHGIRALLENYTDARKTIAKLVNADPEHVAMMQTCAAAISQVALGIKLQKYDEIVRLDQEYPSNAYPWHEAARRSGAAVKIVPSNDDFTIRMDRLLEAITPRTKVVAVSWVQFQTGNMVDLKQVGIECKRNDAWFVVDAIQGLGVIPFDMQEYGVDAVCGGSHKWLCGPLGHGFLALNSKRTAELTPVLHGAFTYGLPEDPVDLNKPYKPNFQRFEPGSPLLLGAIGTAASIKVMFEIGIQKIHERAIFLSDRLIQGIQRSGGTVLGDKTGKIRSPIVTFIPRSGSDRAVELLTSANVSFFKKHTFTR